MIKKYFLHFGVGQNDIKTLVERLEGSLGLIFRNRDSHFSGDYFLYQGDRADSVLVERNYNEAIGDWNEDEFRQYPIIIHVSNTEGKNVDKERRTTSLKSEILKIEGVVLLRENVYEF